MLSVAHDACLETPMKTGGSYREHLTVLSRAMDPMKREQALLELARVPVDEAFEYLRGWHHQLFGRSGVSMHGIAPLTWESLDAWARRSLTYPTVQECETLMQMDAVRRNPPAMKDLLPQLLAVREDLQ